MALPAAVKKQVDEANRLHKSTYQPEDGEQPDDAGLEGAPPPDDTVEPEQGAKPEPQAKPPAPSDEEDKWETRYKVLQGKYNAEVPLLQRQKRELEERLDRLESLISDMNEQRQAAPATSEQLVTEEEMADYGPEFMDMVGRMARQVNREEIARLNATISKLEQQLQSVGGKVQKTEQESIYGQLDKNVENWREVNRNPQFLEWLAQRDPFSGRGRREMLQEAFNRGDAQRVIAFFNGFLREHAAVTESGTSGPGKQKSETTGQLDKMVAPGRGRSGGNQTGARDEKRIWTEAEIAQFFTDKRKGAFKGKEKLAQQLENDIFAAQREGRINTDPRVPYLNAAY